jgi:hypothetical protein
MRSGSRDFWLFSLLESEHIVGLKIKFGGRTLI